MIKFLGDVPTVEKTLTTTATFASLCPATMLITQGFVDEVQRLADRFCLECVHDMRENFQNKLNDVVSAHEPPNMATLCEVASSKGLEPGHIATLLAINSTPEAKHLYQCCRDIDDLLNQPEALQHSFINVMQHRGEMNDLKIMIQNFQSIKADPKLLAAQNTCGVLQAIRVLYKTPAKPKSDTKAIQRKQRIKYALNGFEARNLTLPQKLMIALHAAYQTAEQE